MAEQFDVIIVGGGPAGTACATALCQTGLSVLVLERSNYDSFRPGEHLAARAITCFEQLQLAPPDDQPFCVSCPLVRSAWGSDELIDQDAIFNPHGSGWLLSRPSFDRWLAEQAASRGARVLTECRIESVLGTNAGQRLVYSSDGKTHQAVCRFIVDATGRSARVSRLLDDDEMSVDSLIGVTAYGTYTGQPECADIVVESSRHGWWYSGTLSGGRLAVSLMTDPDLVDVRSGCTAVEFICSQDIPQHTTERISNVEFEPEFFVRPARSRRLKTIADSSRIAIGDAAMSWDPISGSGLFNALNTAIVAASAIVQSLNSDQSGVTAYRKWIQAEFERYTDRKAQHYRREQRWAKEEFWTRRQ